MAAGTIAGSLWQVASMMFRPLDQIALLICCDACLFAEFFVCHIHQWGRVVQVVDYKGDCGEQQRKLSATRSDHRFAQLSEEKAIAIAIHNPILSSISCSYLLHCTVDQHAIIENHPCDDVRMLLYFTNLACSK